jgi:hypothetical protein
VSEACATLTGMAETNTSPLKTLRGTNLRYTLTRLLQLCGPSTVNELVAALRHWGFTVDGRPSKTVSDALRWEREHDRVRKIDRGLYRAGGIPSGTEYRIIRRVAFLREKATPEDAGRGGRVTRGHPRRTSQGPESLRGGNKSYASENAAGARGPEATSRAWP